MLSARRNLVVNAEAERRSQYVFIDTLRAHLRVLVTRILQKHGYPPDKQETATAKVLSTDPALA